MWCSPLLPFQQGDLVVISSFSENPAPDLAGRNSFAAERANQNGFLVILRAAVRPSFYLDPLQNITILRGSKLSPKPPPRQRIDPSQMFSNLPAIISASVISSLVPFLVWKALWWRAGSRFLPGALWLFFLVAAATEVVVLTYSLLHMPNAWIVHIYTVIEYGLLAHVLSAWQENPAVRRAIKASIPAYLCLYLIVKFTGVEPFDAKTINYLSRPIALFLISGFSWYTLSQFWSRSSEKLSRNFRLWILMALITYYNGSIILDSFLYIENHDILLYLVYARSGLNILHNLLFTVGVMVAFVTRPAARVQGL